MWLSYNSNHFNMLFLKVFSFLISTCYYCSAGNRLKRVLNGARVVGREGPYDAVRYMVGIGSVHGVPFYTRGFHDSLKEFGIYGTINCGGALLTPVVIQTACHCVATFGLPPFSRRARINYHWESVRVIYIGINDRFGEPFSMLTRPPVKSQKFFIHKLCEKVQKGLKPDSYDFGLIKVDPSWIKGNDRVPTTNVQFAPVYTVGELSKTYRAFLKNLLVCLNLGYGIYNDDDNPSDFIRAGWTHLINDKLCTAHTCIEMTRSDIYKYKTWVCAEEFPNNYHPVLSGDSGSPFTCNNAYFGVVSQSLRQTDGSKSRRIGTYSAVLHAIYENAWEHRAAFQEEIIKFSTDTYVSVIEKIIDRVVPFRRNGIAYEYSKSTAVSRLLLESATDTSSEIINVPLGLLICLVDLLLLAFSV